MRRLIPGLSLALGLGAWAADAPHQGHRPWSDVEHWSRVFDDQARDEWQKPIALYTFLGVAPGDVVADLGAGTGYFTKFLSMGVGPEGKVYAVDIEQAMLDHLMARPDVMKERVVPVRAAPGDPRLPAGQVDLVVIMNTWHHVDQRGKYLRRLQASLSPEGRVAVIDFREGDLPVGPPAGDKLSREEVVGEFTDARWRLVAESVLLPYQYTLIFLPPARRDTRAFLSH